MRSKQPMAALVSGIAVKKVDAGVVNKVMVARDMIAWLVERLFEPCTWALISYAIKVRTGANICGV